MDADGSGHFNSNSLGNDIQDVLVRLGSLELRNPLFYH